MLSSTSARTSKPAMIGRLGALAAAAVLLIPGVADAKTRYKVVKSTGTIQGHVVEPVTPAGYSFAGLVDDSRLGTGATTSEGTFSGATTTGTLKVYLDKGTIHGTFAFVATPNADGSISFAGTTKYVGGTARYKGAKGSGSITATQDAQGYTTFQYQQKLKIPRR